MDNYADLVSEAIKSNLLEMAGVDAQISFLEAQAEDTFICHGFVILVGITGLRKGRIIFDTTRETAHELSKRINQEDAVDLDLIIDTMCELGNIVSGNIITRINNLHKDSKLMLAPPSVLMGDKLTLTSPKVGVEKLVAVTPAGPLVISVGFERGE